VRQHRHGAALIEHPAVAEAAVVPSHDPRRLVVPKALVALVKVTRQERRLSIFRFMSAHLAPSNACGTPNSPTCRRRSPARFAVSNYAPAPAVPPTSGKTIS
jgi:hypothetical protein